MSLLPGRLKRWLEGLRFPVLLIITAIIFVINLFIPDALPLVDEALLFLLTLLLARLKRRGTGQEETADSGGSSDS